MFYTGKEDTDLLNAINCNNGEHPNITITKTDKFNDIVSASFNVCMFLCR